MSLQTMNKKHLQAVAFWYGVDLGTASSNGEIVSVLEEKGISEKGIEKYDFDKAAEFFSVDLSDSKTDLDKLAALTTDGVEVRQYDKFVASEQVEEVEEKPATITTADLESAEDDQAEYWRRKFEQLQAQQDSVKVETKRVNAESAPSDGKVLIVMTRANPSFEVAGVRFTKAFPYALVTEDKANYICSKFAGFRPAIPSEVKEFYS